MKVILKPEQLVGLKGRIGFDIENDTRANFKPTDGLLLGCGIWSPDNDLYGFLPTNSVAEERDLFEIVQTWESGSYLIAHNAKYELNWLRFDPSTVQRFNIVDTKVLEHMLTEDQPLDLGSCEKRRLGTRSKQQLLHAIGEDLGLDIKKIQDWPLDRVAEYCINDCRLTYEITAKQFPMIRSIGMQDLLDKAMKYTPILYKIEQNGMKASKAKIEDIKTKADQMLQVGEEQLERLILAELDTDEFKLPNYNSSQQLSKLLYEDLGIPTPVCPPELKGSPKAKPYETKTKTAKALLQKLDHPVAKKVLTLKAVKKILSYVASYEKLGVDEGDHWLLNPVYNQTGTKTARLSCSLPNMQQVSSKPVATEMDPDGLGLRLRNIFVAKEGHSIVGIDYQQMEVVAFALTSKEPVMTKIVNQEGDVHQNVAKMIFGEYDPLKRKIVKTLNFGLLYGLGAAGMAEMMGVSLAECNQYMSQYFGTFKGVKAWMQDVQNEVIRKRYVTYWSGRRRRIMDKRDAYKAVNSIIQGGCADVVMEAVIACDEFLTRHGSGQMIGVVHDEIIFELPNEGLDQLTQKLQSIMAVPHIFGTPFRTDVDVGSCWDENAYD